MDRWPRFWVGLMAGAGGAHVSIEQVWRRPAIEQTSGLARQLERAAVAASPCTPTAAHQRSVSPAPRPESVGRPVWLVLGLRGMWVGLGLDWGWMGVVGWLGGRWAWYGHDRV